MRRRELIGGLFAAALSSSAQAQQTAKPVIGFIDSRTPDAVIERLRRFRQGLKDTGFAEGENVTIEYRWGENNNERLPDLAADLVRRQVAVLVPSGGNPVTLAAKAATATTPIVFLAAEDPVKLGLVASLARPGGNLTGINFLNIELTVKELELLHQLVPNANQIAVLVDPRTTADTLVHDVESGARAMGLKLHVLKVTSSIDIDRAFEATTNDDALLVVQSPFLNGRRVQVVQWAARRAIPAVYNGVEFAEIGGLMSYGSDIPEAYRQVGMYVGQILKGAKPADLPVVQASKFQLVINAQTARMIGIEVPPTLLATADEVIE
jgi:putative tryptophan/tyrosine transport system substrate-binding protein